MDKSVFLFVIAIFGTYTYSLPAEGAESRIINGLPAEENEFTYSISLQQLSQIQIHTKGHRCGGALVSLRNAVTLASCTFDTIAGESTPIKPEEYRVFAGSVSLLNDGPDHVRSITSFTVHPQYGTTNNPAAHDIAIILLESPFLRTTVRPVPTMTIGFVMLGAECTLSSWGSQNASASASTQLMYKTKHIDDSFLCGVYHSSVAPQQLTLTDNMICATGNDHAGCNGDLGSPLIRNGNLTGLLLRSHNCMVTNSRYPEVYTRVSSYHTWISNNIVPDSNGASTVQLGIAVMTIYVVLQIIRF